RSYFIDKLTYPTSYVVDRETVEKGPDWWRQPNGTGPFEVSRWEPGSILELKRNTDYHGTPPLVDVVQFLLLAGVPMSLYEQGQIDVVSISSSYIEQATDPANPLHLELLSAPELSLYYVGFDVTRPPFDDVNVRLAFCHAVDRQRIVTVLFKDSVGVAGGVLPAGLPGYDPSFLPYAYDPVLARELLAKSSYGSAEALPPLTLTVSGYANQIPDYIAAVLLDWKQNLGVEATVRQLEPEVFLYYLEEERDQAFAMGWIADYASPHNFLGTLFSGGESYNISGYVNPVFEELLARAAAEPEEEARLALYREAERVLADDAPCLPLMYGSNQVLVKPYVSGYAPNALGVPDLTTVSVDRP
ncbi:MAG: peptide ABC transporter substrate-binding protein, partial [Dehalococcoidia bacterium]|nr:peptide ABC transporter substrate-binding protein [Dehalococcoidia bacterium]